MRTFFRLILAGVVVAIIGLGAQVHALLARFDSAGPLAAGKTVVIPRGAGLRGIAAELEGEGVVSSRLSFILGTRLAGKMHALRAGEYAFPAGVSGRAVMEILVEGKVVHHAITFAEGLTSREMVDTLMAEPALSGEVSEIPGEGTLLPETYEFLRGDERASILSRVAEAQEKTLAGLWAARDPLVALVSPQEAVILASIVEKETGVSGERARIAGVFFNRLALGMPLQSDPTVIYALTEGKRDLGRALIRKDWQFPSPYNTYGNRGLPPGPICNPGRAALEAVLHPERHDYLYFVADGSGGHAFSRTLSEHNRAARAH